MNVSTSALKPDQSVAALAITGLIALSLFLQHEFSLKQSILFLIGIGLGISLFHALFGFTGGWRRMIRERRSADVRAQILLLAVTSFLFFPVLGHVFTGVEAHGAVAQVGVSVLVGAFLFGIGMQLGGGCGSGTLFTVGWGQVDMLITLAFFIIGATLGSAHLHWWTALPGVGKVSLIDNYGWLPALALQVVVFTGLYILARTLEQQRHGNVKSLLSGAPQSSISERLIHGPWPLWWGVTGLAFFNLLTLLVAGHPWSITFAFSLWGAKIWSALGGDVLAWPYWSAGYPARALSHSVLADTTSLMDFGIMSGALLAAALAGKFAPESVLKWKRVATAVIGGLLLGYGARLAFGCNIGGMLAGIASGSLHGWLWLVAGFTGGITGLYLKVLFHIDRPFGRS